MISLGKDLLATHNIGKTELTERETIYSVTSVPLLRTRVSNKYTVYIFENRGNSMYIIAKETRYQIVLSSPEYSGECCILRIGTDLGITGSNYAHAGHRD